MIFIWKKKKRMQGSFLTILLLYSLTLMPEACPKALASPTLYSPPQFRLWAAFQPHYAAGFPQQPVAACTGTGKGLQWSQHRTGAGAVPAAGPGSRREPAMQKGPVASLEVPLPPRAAMLPAIGSSLGMAAFSCKWDLGVNWRGLC